MCLAMPAEVVEIKGDHAIVDFGGVRKRANTSLIRGVNVGDYVIVHVGYVIHKRSKEKALESIKSWKELL